MSAEQFTEMPAFDPHATRELPLILLEGSQRFHHVIQTPPERFTASSAQPQQRSAGIDSRGRVVAVQPGLFERETVVAIDTSEHVFPSTAQEVTGESEGIYTPPDEVVPEDKSEIQYTQELPIWTIYWHAGGFTNKLQAIWNWIKYQEEDATVAYEEVIRPFFAGIFRAVYRIVGIRQRKLEEAPTQFMRFNEGPYILTPVNSSLNETNTFDTIE